MYKVKIKDFEYTIIETDNKWDDRLYWDNEYTIGICKRTTLEIIILNTLPIERIKKILIHELTHAFFEAYGFYDYIFNEEDLCSFMGAYSEDIVYIANEYMNQRGSKEQWRIKDLIGTEPISQHS